MRRSRPDGHELHLGAPAARGDAVVKRHEIVAEHLDAVAVRRARLGLGEAYGADRRMAEDDRGDEPVIEVAIRLAAE